MKRDKEERVGMEVKRRKRREEREPYLCGNPLEAKLLNFALRSEESERDPVPLCDETRFFSSIRPMIIVPRINLTGNGITGSNAPEKATEG